MIEYGNLRFVEEEGWVFIKEGKVEQIEAEGFIEAFNDLGTKRWSLVTYVEQVGYMFKRSVN